MADDSDHLSVDSVMDMLSRRAIPDGEDLLVRALCGIWKAIDRQNQLSEQVSKRADEQAKAFSEYTSMMKSVEKTYAHDTNLRQAFMSQHMNPEFIEDLEPEDDDGPVCEHGFFPASACKYCSGEKDGSREEEETEGSA